MYHSRSKGFASFQTVAFYTVYFESVVYEAIDMVVFFQVHSYSSQYSGKFLPICGFPSFCVFFVAILCFLVSYLRLSYSAVSGMFNELLALILSLLHPASLHMQIC